MGILVYFTGNFVEGYIENIEQAEAEKIISEYGEGAVFLEGAVIPKRTKEEKSMDLFWNGKSFYYAVLETTRQETQLDRIERLVQTNADLQSFYDDIIEEAGL